MVSLVSVGVSVRCSGDCVSASCVLDAHLCFCSYHALVTVVPLVSSVFVSMFL